MYIKINKNICYEILYKLANATSAYRIQKKPSKMAASVLSATTTFSGQFGLDATIVDITGELQETSQMRCNF